MKKLLTAALFSIAILSFFGMFIKAATPSDTFNVSLTTMFDGDNSSIATEMTDQAYGSKLTLNDSFGDTSDHDFAFWVVNGSVREDLPVDHEFTIKDTLNVQAVFSKSSEHAAAFMDVNGKLIDSQYVLTEEDATDPRNAGSSDTYTETFDNYPETGTAYNQGSFEGVTDNNITWNYVESNAAGEDMIDGKAVSMDKAGDGSELTATIPDGIDSFEVDYTNTHSTPAGVELLINGTSKGSSTEVDGTTGTFTVSDIDVSRSFDLKLKPTNGQTTVDNLTWTSPGGIELPDKPGYIVNDTSPWDNDLTNLTSDNVFILQYVKDSSETYNLTVNNGSGEGTYDYNEIVTVTPDTAPSDESFSHWESDGEIVSYDEDYAFTMLADKTVEAVFKTTPESEQPLITRSDELNLRTGYTSYLSQFNIPSGHTLVDYGLIASDTQEAIELDTQNTTKYTGSKYVGETGEFLISTSSDHDTVRAYLVLEDSSGNLSEYYSPYQEPITEPATYTETFENYPETGSTYQDGSYTGDNRIEWTYAAARGDMDINGTHALTFGDDSRAPSLTATIPEGIHSFSVDFTNAFSSPAELALYINGSLVGESQSVDGTVETFDVQDIDIDGTFDLELKATNGQTTIDDLTWENASSAEPLISLESSYPEADLTATPSLQEPAGTDVTVSADDPTNTYNFIQWEDSSGNVLSTDASYTFTLQENITLNAVFDNPDLYTLNLDSNLSRADLSTDPSMPVEEGTDVTVSASDPDGTYPLLRWEDDSGNTISEQASFTYTVGTSDETLNAIFELPTEDNYQNMTLSELTAIDLDPMYDSAEGLYGDDLRAELASIISGIDYQSYGDARTILAETDQDPTNPDNLILIYTRDSVPGEWDEGTTWNREHVWPQSLMDVDTDNSSTHKGSDLHNLAPADPSENSSRSNDHFTEDGSGYNPPDVVKGDVARMLFYMDTMYSELSLVDGTPSTYEMGDLDDLLQWTVEDSIDSFEENRNDVIASYQNNRNPFIDHPHLAYLIYYDHPQVDLGGQQ